VFTDWLEANLVQYDSSIALPDTLKYLWRSEQWQILINDPSNEHGGRLTGEDISLFTGVPLK
jgi:hypothetical protein